MAAGALESSVADAGEMLYEGPKAESQKHGDGGTDDEDRRHGAQITERVPTDFAKLSFSRPLFLVGTAAEVGKCRHRKLETARGRSSISVCLHTSMKARLY